jgi:glucose/arabinose dehydrogenase
LYTASTGLDVYEAAQFPAEYDGTVFVTIWGNFFEGPEFPPQLFNVETESGAVRTFAEGFSHPIDVMVDRDGTLLVLDYGDFDDGEGTGALYRIVYTGEQ